MRGPLIKEVTPYEKQAVTIKRKKNNIQLIKCFIRTKQLSAIPCNDIFACLPFNVTLKMEALLLKDLKHIKLISGQIRK